MSINKVKVGLDIDGVLANFAKAVIDRAKKMGLHAHFPDSHKDIAHWGISSKFSHVMKDAWMDENFWLGLEPIQLKLPEWFDVKCYITARPIPSEVTKRWLAANGLPDAPVVSVKYAEEKLEHVADYDLDIFIDDYYPTIWMLRENGINGVLYGAPYQVGHEEECKGLPKINSLEEAKWYVKDNFRI